MFYERVLLAINVGLLFLPFNWQLVLQLIMYIWPVGPFVYPQYVYFFRMFSLLLEDSRLAVFSKAQLTILFKLYCTFVSKITSVNCSLALTCFCTISIFFEK